VQELTLLYVCRRCFSAETTAGPCPRCGLERARCEVGAPGARERRPPMDAAGRLLCRAPWWWVVQCAPYLRARKL
jgi:hypothetical protein